MPHACGMKGLVLTLFVFSILFIGGGLLVMLTRGFGTLQWREVFGVSLMPIVFGFVPLSGVAVCLAVDEARRDVLAAMRKD